MRAVAFTTIGLGPFSPPTHFLMDPAYLKFTVVPTGKGPSGVHKLFRLKIVKDKNIFLELLTTILIGDKPSGFLMVIVHEF